MLRKINRIMRNIILVAGAVLVIFKLFDSNRIEKKSEKEGFQTEEFDDIW